MGSPSSLNAFLGQSKMFPLIFLLCEISVINNLSVLLYRTMTPCVSDQRYIREQTCIQLFSNVHSSLWLLQNLKHGWSMTNRLAEFVCISRPSRRVNCLLADVQLAAKTCLVCHRRNRTLGVVSDNKEQPIIVRCMLFRCDFSFVPAIIYNVVLTGCTIIVSR